MGLLQTLRKWLKPGPEDAEAAADAKRLEDDKLTVRASQAGRLPYGNLPPTPDVLDPERDQR